MEICCKTCGVHGHFAGNKKFHPDKADELGQINKADELGQIMEKLSLKEQMLSGKLITKEKRHELYGSVAGGSGSTKPEKYQRQQIETITGKSCKTTNMRINWRSNKMVEIAHPMTKVDGYDYTEDFDGSQTFGDKTVWVNLKCVVDKGGSQTRTLRDECYHFIEAQLKYLLNHDNNYYFANIFDGDQAAANQSKFEYLLGLPEYVLVKENVYVGDLKSYFDWVELKM